jgi:hypothetical protein
MQIGTPRVKTAKAAPNLGNTAFMWCWCGVGVVQFVKIALKPPILE